ncbi:hypothetical protein EZS27_033139, partial [termite gut metagenome]
LYHRSRRPIEPEAVFGQTKANKQYNRFRHFGEDKVKMDFAIFAIAFNLGKLARKVQKVSENKQKSLAFMKNSFLIVIFVLLHETKGDLDNKPKIAA